MALELKLDVINNALIHCGVDPLSAAELTANTDARAVACNARFTGAKQALLRKLDWKFARKRVLLSTFSGQVTITGITKASQVVVTAPSHSVATGDFIAISEVVGMTELNGLTSVATYVDPISFSLDTIDSTGFTTYVSSGIAWDAPRFNYTFQHDLPSDCITLLTQNLKREHKLDGQKIVSNYDTVEILYTSDVNIDTVATADSGFTETLALYLAWNICNHVSEDDRRRKTLMDDYLNALDSAAADTAQEESPIVLDDSEWINAREVGPYAPGEQSRSI